MNKLFNTYTR